VQELFRAALDSPISLFANVKVVEPLFFLPGILIHVQKKLRRLADEEFDLYQPIFQQGDAMKAFVVAVCLFYFSLELVN
jgi:hypothetical protein